ncbi:MAG: TonB-dependent receptor, partial [Chitinophagaceae bacterium]
MKKLIATLALAGISICTYAQNGGKITGMIKDGGNQKVIDAASISLLKSQDSSLVKTSLTNKDGSFSFENLKEGKYLVVASSIGHSKVYSSPLEISAGSLEANTGVLQLVASSKDLAAVTVTAKKQFIERKIDKTVINPDAMISNSGATALEMLEKAPGITIDKDGNISLKGKQGVMVMLDGKPSYMSGADLVNYLNNLPAGNIDQVEIMTNPPAKYDAAGNSGIINIKSKKNKLRGFNGNLSTSQGHGKSFRSANSLSLNYRRGKVNTFSTFNVNYRENPQWLDIDRELLRNDKSVESIFEQKTSRMRINRWFNAKRPVEMHIFSKGGHGFGPGTIENTTY